MSLLRHAALLGLLVASPLAAQTPAATPPAPPVALDYDSLAFGRQLNSWFYGSQVDSLWAHTAPQMQEQLGSKDKWSEMIGQFVSRAGFESEVVEERWVKRSGRRQYWHIFRATEFTEEPLMIRWVLLPGKLLGGIGFNPLSQAPAVDPN